MEPYERTIVVLAALQSNINDLVSLLAKTQRLRQFALNHGYTAETLPGILSEARDADYTRGITLTTTLKDNWEAKIDAVTLPE